MEWLCFTFFQSDCWHETSGVPSPLFFAIFIDQLVDRVKTVNVGCYIPVSTVCYGIFLYADDILLIAPTVSGLQAMLTAV